LETVHQDIHDAADPLLDAETFETAWTYDALGRVVTHTTPDQSVTEQSYSPRGLVSALAVKIRGAGTATDIVTAVAYNARGQRLRVDAANDVVSNFEYDPATFRVRRIHTERPHTDPDLRRVQDLRYHYDPVGNITRIRDLAQAGVFFDNAYADPTQSFTYDPLYRLTQATGREHDALPQPTAEGFAPIAHPQDTQAQRNYAQTYTYDPAGNILRMKHSSGGVTVWHRGYTYATTGNRLLATTLPGDDLEDPEDYSEPYTYDAHGNMTAMPTIPGGLTWDPQDRLIKTDHQGGGVTYYVYDSAGQRVRKVHLNQAATISTERYYLGPWETYKKTTDLQGTPTLDTERETLHVHTPAGADCLIETKTVEDETPLGTPTPLLRYQHHNHLGTATLELSEDAEVITYEEYHPYGTSAYRAANSAIEASPKRYRYTGKERDEETGLYYHEARYYACWLARWLSSISLRRTIQWGPLSRRCWSHYSRAMSAYRGPSSTGQSPCGTTSQQNEHLSSFAMSAEGLVRFAIRSLALSGHSCQNQREGSSYARWWTKAEWLACQLKLFRGEKTRSLQLITLYTSHCALRANPARWSGPQIPCLSGPAMSLSM
jgi:RHS repeat-associated protein